MDLAARIVALHRALAGATLPYGFGGALALAWCTERARGTIDIDINVFVPVDQADTVYDALPRQVAVSPRNRAEIARDGQTRLWWHETPVDLFLNTTEFHEQVATRTRVETFAGERVPFLGCDDLAVFKAFFNRTKDWADLEAMIEVGSVDVERVLGTLARHLGPTDERIDRLLRISG